MKWNNVHRDKLPPDGQHTLLAVNGIYYLTFYDAKRGFFRLKDDPESYFTVDEGPSMYWTPIDEPPHVRDDY